MNYDNPELIHRLAGAYVLGTLEGRARKRFERLALESMPVRQAIWAWERRLNPLADGQHPVAPAPSVWSAIEKRLFAAEKSTPDGGKWWKLLSAGLAVALLLLVLPQTRPPLEPVSEQLAFIQDDSQQPLWVIAVDTTTGLLKSRAINEPAREADRVFELWMLPAEGQPRSFGLLPAAGDGRVSSTLSPALLALLGNAKGLAVSIEPPGGSPTGAPTGPVVYVAPILEL